ncbi:NAD-dependent epimerase/dehydratase family protein [Cytophagia bacterium CHB2]|nr:NAD-dependent epimerase/dehydratase family protein [Cytophagia bacterium CHB2]
MPRTLVTGGAGFLGSHLCEYLLHRGHEVIAMDNLLTGTTDNIEHLRGERFKFIKHDVTEYIYLAGELDYILHFASPASPLDYLQLPIQTMKVGALGTHKALGLAKDTGATFLLASTSEVYGDPLLHPQTEDYWGHVNPIGPRGVYDEAKRFAEALTMAYHRTHGVDTKIVRIFNTYGPRMRPNDGRAIPAFIPQALHHEPITVFGDGTQQRAFTYVGDIAPIIARSATMPEAYGEVFNVGADTPYTVNELATLVMEAMGMKGELRHLEARNEVVFAFSDHSKARRIFGDVQETTLEEGLQRMVPWARRSRKGMWAIGIVLSLRQLLGARHAHAVILCVGVVHEDRCSGLLRHKLVGGRQ